MKALKWNIWVAKEDSEIKGLIMLMEFWIEWIGEDWCKIGVWTKKQEGPKEWKRDVGRSHF